MSVFKYFAPPEWDDDVPEITEGINLTKKNKLRKKVKYSKEEKSDNITEDVNTINALPAKRKNDPFEVVTPKKKKKRKNETESYVKFDSPKIDNTLTDSFQLEINNTATNKITKNHSNINRNDVKEIAPKKKKKDKISFDTNGIESNEIVTKKKKKDNISFDTNSIKTDANEIAPKKKKKDNIGIDTDSIKTDANEFAPKKKKKNNAEKETQNDITAEISSEEINKSSEKKIKKTGKNKLKKDKNKQSEVLQNSASPVEPICTVASQIVVDNKSKSSKKCKLHLKKIKGLLENMKTNTEPTDATDDVNIENTAILSSLNDKEDVEKKSINVHKSLRERMMERLKGARFRYINEQLYVKQSNEAHQVFKDDPGAFAAYHSGYRQQVNKWPINPLDVIIKDILKLPKNHVVADLGCGDARLSKSVPHKVFSFDLVALDPSINACDMSHTPLLTGQVDVVVFCLSLMSTNLKNYLIEANRVLKTGGLMKIAEVESRFNDIDQFMTDVKKYGFSIIKKDLDHNLFYFIDFKKENDIKKRNKLPDITLNPCLYKKR